MRFVLLICSIALGFGVCADRAGAAQTVTLPSWVCAHPDAVFSGGFEAGQVAVPNDPSAGSGGATGSITRHVHIGGLGNGTQTYYLYVPSDYTPARSWPLVFALDGYAPYASAASYAAQVRDDWSSIASAGQFIVAAPVGNDVVFQNNQPYGISWLVPPTVGPNDYDVFAAIRMDLEGAYNIERTRIYGWGFSAGGHVMHDLGVNTYSDAFNASTMAAYSVSAGDLSGLACERKTDVECSQLLAAMPRKIPVDIHIGTSDPNFTYAQSDHTRFVTEGWVNGQTIYYVPFPGGHTYTIAQLGDIWHNLCGNAVVP